MIDGVGQLIPVQAQVHGVQYGAHAHHTQVHLEVLGVVPCQAADPVARANSESVQRMRQPGCSRNHLAEVALVALPSLGIDERHDLLRSVNPFHPAKDVMDRQREVHHQARDCDRAFTGRLVRHVSDDDTSSKAMVQAELIRRPCGSPRAWSCRFYSPRTN